MISNAERLRNMASKIESGRRISSRDALVLHNIADEMENFRMAELDDLSEPVTTIGDVQFNGPRTLRDDFAMNALIGLFAQCADPNSPGIAANDYAGAAVEAYRMADAMLQARGF